MLDCAWPTQPLLTTTSRPHAHAHTCLSTDRLSLSDDRRRESTPTRTHETEASQAAMEEISHRIHDAAKKGSIEDVARLLKVREGSIWVEMV